MIKVWSFQQIIDYWFLKDSQVWSIFPSPLHGLSWWSKRMIFKQMVKWLIQIVFRDKDIERKYSQQNDYM